MTPDDLHKTIAMALTADAPPGWEIVWTEGEVFDDYSDLLFACASLGGKVTYFTPSYEDNEVVHKSLQAIREQMQEIGREKWTRCKFTLWPSGRFDLHIDYLPLQHDHLDITRDLAERHFWRRPCLRMRQIC